MQEVVLGARPLDGVDPVLDDDERCRLDLALRQLRSLLAGRRLWQ
jgi:hypothetical protein